MAAGVIVFQGFSCPSNDVYLWLEFDGKLLSYGILNMTGQPQDILSAGLSVIDQHQGLVLMDACISGAKSL